MTTSIYLLFFSLLAPDFDGRAVFQPGYVIDNNGRRTEVLIYDADWKNNPDRFRYRSNEYGDAKVGDLSSVREFGYDNQTLRYRRYVVDIDRSSDGRSKMSTSDQPEYARDTVFLEWLVDGDSDLFYYEGEKKRRYFYRTGDDAPKPLLNRKYRDGDRVVVQNAFREELLKEVNCAGDDAAIETLECTTDDLVSHFEAHNACVGAQSVTTIRKKRARTSFAVSPRVGYGSYQGDFLRSEGDIAFRPISALRYGVELEAGLPFAQRHLALFAEVGYISLSSKSRLPDEASVYLDYQAVYLPVGVRYMLPLAGKISAQAMAGVEAKFPTSSSIERYMGDASQEVGMYEASNSFSPFGGIGLTFSNRIVFDIRYVPNQDFLGDRATASTNIDALTISLGYQMNL